MIKTTTTRAKLIDLLQYMRPAYSPVELAFCREHLVPVFGEPDVHGNYILSVGDNPTIAFTAHTDTVHKVGGLQKLKIEDNVVTTVTGDCLGADCTTGIWLLLGMIEAGIEGVYIAHAAEEIGGVGSTNLVSDNPDWLSNIQVCLSFDRFGTDSIITHQGGLRTASDSFAHSLSEILGMPNLKPDSTGTYTDSAEYACRVPECSNLSVGYHDQHTKLESQDLTFAETLLERLVEADWSALRVERDPTLLEADYHVSTGLTSSDDDQAELESLKRLLVDRPSMVAGLLFEYGLTATHLCEELGLDPQDLTYYLEDRPQYFC